MLGYEVLTKYSRINRIGYIRICSLGRPLLHHDAFVSNLVLSTCLHGADHDRCGDSQVALLDDLGGSFQHDLLSGLRPSIANCIRPVSGFHLELPAQGAYRHASFLRADLPRKVLTAQICPILVFEVGLDACDPTLRRLCSMSETGHGILGLYVQCINSLSFGQCPVSKSLQICLTGRNLPRSL